MKFWTVGLCRTLNNGSTRRKKMSDSVAIWGGVGCEERRSVHVSPLLLKINRVSGDGLSLFELGVEVSSQSSSSSEG